MAARCAAPFTKFAKRVLDWSTIEIDLRRAFRDATSPPQGVALVEIPTNILYQAGLESDQRRGAKVYAPGELKAGRTALVNVVGDRAIGNPGLGGNLG
jgi:thiamine pyrophosphate-dependent acetolactate synthase large subunit-like protein